MMPMPDRAGGGSMEATFSHPDWGIRPAPRWIISGRWRSKSISIWHGPSSFTFSEGANSFMPAAHVSSSQLYRESMRSFSTNRSRAIRWPPVALIHLRWGRYVSLNRGPQPKPGDGESGLHIEITQGSTYSICLSLTGATGRGTPRPVLLPA